MFKVIDVYGEVHNAYGTFVDKDGDVQFILANRNGYFYVTNVMPGTYTLYREEGR